MRKLVGKSGVDKSGIIRHYDVMHVLFSCTDKKKNYPTASKLAGKAWGRVWVSVVHHLSISFISYPFLFYTSIYPFLLHLSI